MGHLGDHCKFYFAMPAANMPYSNSGWEGIDRTTGFDICQYSDQVHNSRGPKVAQVKVTQAGEIKYLAAMSDHDMHKGVLLADTDANATLFLINHVTGRIKDATTKLCLAADSAQAPNNAGASMAGVHAAFSLNLQLHAHSSTVLPCCSAT